MQAAHKLIVDIADVKCNNILHVFDNMVHFLIHPKAIYLLIFEALLPKDAKTNLK